MKDYVSAEAERILLADDYQDLARAHGDLLLAHLDLDYKFRFLYELFRQALAARIKAETALEKLMGAPSAWPENES